MSREQELGLDRNRKKFDAREEYFVSSSFLPSVRPPSFLISRFLLCVEAECGG
jgi:hypothetical protein